MRLAAFRRAYLWKRSDFWRATVHACGERESAGSIVADLNGRHLLVGNYVYSRPAAPNDRLESSVLHRHCRLSIFHECPRWFGIRAPVCPTFVRPESEILSETIRERSNTAHLFRWLVEDDLRIDQPQSIFELQLNFLSSGHQRIDQFGRAGRWIVAGEQGAELFRFTLQRIDAFANSLEKHVNVVFVLSTIESMFCVCVHECRFCS